jgi:hypothetical protein
VVGSGVDVVCSGVGVVGSGVDVVGSGVSTHGPPFGPTNPISHVHIVKRLLPLTELEFTGQFEQVLAPVVVEYVPATQSRHVASPVTVLYFPAPHSVHVAAPVTVLYFPELHAVHVPPLSPVYPTLHVQCVMSNAVVHWVLPFDGQSMQGLESNPVLYLPKGQLRQFGGLPVRPAPHKHEDESVCASSWCPVPASQPLHSAEPILDLYVPKPQAVHVPPVGPVVPAGH